MEINNSPFELQIVHRSCNDCAFFFILFSNSAPLFRIKVICLVFSLLHFSTTKIPFHSVFLIDFKVDTRLLYTVAYGWYANYAGVFVLVVAVFVCLYSFDEQFQSNKQGIRKKIQSQNHHHFVAIFIDFFFNGISSLRIKVYLLVDELNIRWKLHCARCKYDLCVLWVYTLWVGENVKSSIYCQGIENWKQKMF